MTKFTVWSDLHLEMNHFEDRFCEVEPGDVLILAGDIISAGHVAVGEIGQTIGLQKLCKHVFPKFEKIIYVMGNHEHYNHDYLTTRYTIKNAIEGYYDKSNFHLLENEYIIHDGCVIFGCTLWSDLSNPIEKLAASGGMNDYQVISYCGGKFTTDVNQNQFSLSMKSLQNWLSLVNSHDQMRDCKKVIVTHHAPSRKSIAPHYLGDGLNGAFATELSSLILDHPEIKMWVHGHTHHSVDYMIGDTRIYSNQLGYTRHGEETHFQVNGNVVL